MPITPDGLPVRRTVEPQVELLQRGWPEALWVPPRQPLQQRQVRRRIPSATALPLVTTLQKLVPQVTCGPQSIAARLCAGCAAGDACRCTGCRSWYLEVSHEARQVIRSLHHGRVRTPQRKWSLWHYISDSLSGRSSQTPLPAGLPNSSMPSSCNVSSTLASASQHRSTWRSSARCRAKGCRGVSS